MELEAKKIKAAKLIIAYPFAMLTIAALLNILLLDFQTFEVALPTRWHLGAMIAAGLVLVLNHSLLMTTTELTRVRYGMYATPEEWEASGRSWKETPEEAIKELERNHNAHRNATENTCYFLTLAFPFMLVSAPVITTYIWLVGFSLSRLGHSIAYLKGKDNLRGVFMSLSLVALYGIASYLAIAWLASV